MDKMLNGHKQIKIAGTSTSEKELKDIIKAWAAVSMAFAIAMSPNLSGFYAKFIISSLTVGIGFLLHELGHKFVAQKYGCFAEFRSFDGMLLIAIAMSFFGFIFAAPGAVMISGRVDKTKHGKIAAAGPLANIALALIFLSISFIQIQGLKGISYYGFFINSLLAAFNLIPFWLLDGYKILKWNKVAYGAMAAATLALMIASSFVKIRA